MAIENKIFKVNELKISSRIREVDAEWIICLHGLKSNKHLFDPIFTIEELKNYSILALDFVGFGESDKPKDFSYNPADQTKIVKTLIEQIGAQKINLIGHSVGGMVGTLLLNESGEKIISFINLEGNLVGKDCSASAEVISQSFEQFKNHAFTELKALLDQDKLQAVNQVPDFVFYKTSQSIVDWSKSEKLLDIFINTKQRKLFVYGEKNKSKIDVLDNKVPVAEIPNSGHFMLTDNSEYTWEIIRDFITKI